MALRNTKNGEKRKMESLSAGITGKKHPVSWIEEGDDLGYTSKDGVIHVAYNSPHFTWDLKPEQAIAFRLGVFGHELLHQIFTDFAALEEILNPHNQQEQSILATLINLIEDPGIEYHAPLVFGGELLSCLRFMIRQVYRCSPPISESPTAFIQVMNALIYFGDIGIIKGDFTFEEAYDAFSKIAPEFFEAIHEMDSRKRMQAAEKWLEDLRPLWEADQKQNEDFMNELDNFMKSNGMSQASGDGSQSGKSPDDNQPDNGSGNNGNGNDSDSSSDSVGEDEQSKRKNEAQKKILSALQKDDGEEGSGENAGSSDENSSMSEFNKKNGLMNASGNPAGNDARDSEIDKETLDSLASQANDLENVCRREAAEKAKENSRFSNSQRSGEILSSGNIQYPFGGRPEEIRALNERMSDKTPDEEVYANMLDENMRQIKMLTSSMTILLNQDKDTKIKTTSGKYNINRGLTRSTVNVFDRKKVSTDVDDIAVMILIDESGSMSWNRKMESARNCCHILTESFSRIGLPCYIIGFSADDYKGHDVVHHHYVTWKNSLAERKSLSLTQAGNNNYDSYSIWYANTILKQKRAEHKILFIISDGMPNCHSYNGKADGLEQTRLAIRDARKTASVIGIGIQCDDQDEMQKMYGGTFTNLSDPSQLTGAVTRMLKKVVSRY